MKSSSSNSLEEDVRVGPAEVVGHRGQALLGELVGGLRQARTASMSRRLAASLSRRAVPDARLANCSSAGRLQRSAKSARARFGVVDVEEAHRGRRPARSKEATATTGRPTTRPGEATTRATTSDGALPRPDVVDVELRLRRFLGQFPESRHEAVAIEAARGVGAPVLEGAPRFEQGREPVPVPSGERLGRGP